MARMPFTSNSKAIAAAASAVLILQLVRTILELRNKKRLKDKYIAIGQEKRAQRDEKRRKTHVECDIDAATEKEIVAMTVTQLVQAILVHRFTSEQIVRVYCKRAKIAGEKFNCTTEEFFLEAIEQAIKADKYFQDTGRLLGPLHGIPVSVKDQFDMAGADSTCGCAVRCFQPFKNDGLLVKLIRSAGGIPFVRTNVPQMLMMTETSNQVWGKTLNPWDVSRTSGGSSGGEGSILACKASPIGLGTDIGGSIRIPSSYCGIYGFKPTPMRLSAKGLSVAQSPAFGNNPIPSVAGPMGHCVEDLAIIMRCWLSEEMWQSDSYIPRLPFNDSIFKYGMSHAKFCMQTIEKDALSFEEREVSPFPGYHDDTGDLRSRSSSLVAEFSNLGSRSRSDSGYACSLGANLHLPTSSSRKLRIGYFLSHPFFEASKACQRAVVEAANALKGMGHDVFEFDFPDIAEGAMCYMGIMTCDKGLQPYIAGLQGEPLDPMYSMQYSVSRLPGLLRSALITLCNYRGHTRMATILRSSNAKSAYEYKQYVHRLKLYRNRVQEAWNNEQVDVVLCPVLALPALPHGVAGKTIPNLIYTTIFNALCYPAGSVPITTVHENEQEYDTVHSDQAASHAVSSMSGSRGLPIGVQVATLPFQDELCLHVMGLLEKSVGLHDVAKL